jgi:F-type H+-transporting ATPase subunit b
MIFLAFAEGSIQLVPDGTIFIHIALILLMIWILNRTLFKPINRVLEERERKTGGRSDSAHNILLEADNKLANYEQSLREARAAGYSTIEKLRSEALEYRRQQIEAVKAEVTDTVAAERAALQNSVAAAQAQLQTDARVLAERISSNILNGSRTAV